MPVITCPSCGIMLKALQNAASRRFRCPKCKASFFAPASPNPIVDTCDLVSEMPKPAPREFSGQLGPPGPKPKQSELDTEDPQYRERRRHRPWRDRESTDAPGVISLIFGCLSVACLLMGCFTCGLTYYAALPFALIGASLGFFGQGNIRIASLTLNFVALIPAIIMLMAFTGIVGLAGLGTVVRQPDGAVNREEDERTQRQLRDLRMTQNRQEEELLKRRQLKQEQDEANRALQDKQIETEKYVDAKRLEQRRLEFEAEQRRREADQLASQQRAQEEEAGRVAREKAAREERLRTVIESYIRTDNPNKSLRIGACSPPMRATRGQKEGLLYRVEVSVLGANLRDAKMERRSTNYYLFVVDDNIIAKQITPGDWHAVKICKILDNP